MVYIYPTDNPIWLSTEEISDNFMIVLSILFIYTLISILKVNGSILVASASWGPNEHAFKPGITVFSVGLPWLAWTVKHH